MAIDSPFWAIIIIANYRSASRYRYQRQVVRRKAAVAPLQSRDYATCGFNILNVLG